TPADAALMMRLGADGVFVGSGIFKSSNPEKMANAIVEAVKSYDDPARLAEISKGLGEPMKGIEVSSIPTEELLQVRGW
ncbi:MAG TPA: pyridoxal 5'-phosphate synthase lyase subunit PdxS, partial [Candidatus Syntrophoarchaeum butanivorans]|nr:pyridoxal 5'-phosphate synthase lyase subunit PdxS [Candidatus Syntrophoarchaeum butanivorans]